MKHLWPLLFILSLKAQTNLFRMYPQMQPSQAYTMANIFSPVKTAEGGFVFSLLPYSTSFVIQNLTDFITIKTNPNFIPQWRRRNCSKILSLPTGGIISIYQNAQDKAYIDKQTASGIVIWSKELKGPNTYTFGMTSTNVSDAVQFLNKFRIIGSTYFLDAGGNKQSIEPYSAEIDTTTGLVNSAHKLTSFNSTSTLPFDFSQLFRDAQGSFYLIGTSKAGITKFSSNFTFMWQLSWINATYNPQVTAIKFTTNGDLMCAMNYYDTIVSQYKPGIMRVNNPATIVFEKQMQNMLGFSGIENMPSGNFLFSYLKKQTVSDTLKTHLLAVDGSANVLWHRSYHQSMAVSPPLALGNGEYLLCSMGSKTSSSTAQNPIAFTIDQFGNSACLNKTIPVSLSNYSSSPVLGTVTTAPITITVSNSPTVNVSLQSFKDTCGGAQLGFLGLTSFNNQQELDFWPNPASNLLYINKNLITKGAEIQIVSLTGQMLKQLNIGDEMIDVSGISPGIYLLNVSIQNQAIRSKKLIISGEK